MNKDININNFSYLITDKELVEYLSKKYNFNINKEVKKAIFSKCNHRFIYLNDEVYCYKCTLTTDCPSCIKIASLEQYINDKSVKSGKFICNNCNCITEWFICNNCNKLTYKCTCQKNKNDKFKKIFFKI